MNENSSFARRCGMASLFDSDGVQFLFPENWELQRDDTDTGWTVSLQSPDTAFLIVAFDAGMPETDYMARTVLEALEEEYKDLESEDCLESVAGQPAVGYD